MIENMTENFNCTGTTEPQKTELKVKVAALNSFSESSHWCTKYMKRRFLSNKKGPGKNGQV